MSVKEAVSDDAANTVIEPLRATGTVVATVVEAAVPDGVETVAQVVVIARTAVVARAALVLVAKRAAVGLVARARIFGAPEAEIPVTAAISVRAVAITASLVVDGRGAGRVLFTTLLGRGSQSLTTSIVID